MIFNEDGKITNNYSKTPQSMNIYLIDNDKSAIDIAQLIKLNAECTKLHWSKSIRNIPTGVINSLNIIEYFVEEKINKECSLFGSLTEDEEYKIMELLKNNSILKDTIGSGVVMAGDQARNVKKILIKFGTFSSLIEALDSGKSVVIF